jgi:hypothetical protein
MLVTIATFINSTEAGFAQNQLQAEGIRAFIVDEAITNWAWHLTVAVGWIKLRVIESDVDDAIDILTATAIDQLSNDDDDLELPSQADRVLEAAFRSTVLGLVFFPLQICSLWFLAELLLLGCTINPKLRLKALVTVLLTFVMVFVLWGFIFLWWSSFANL